MYKIVYQTENNEVITEETENFEEAMMIYLREILKDSTLGAVIIVCRSYLSDIVIAAYSNNYKDDFISIPKWANT